MGIINACSTRNKDPSNDIFNKRENAILQNLYNFLSNKSPEYIFPYL